MEGIPDSAFNSGAPPISSRPQLGLEGVVVHWTKITREPTADLPSPSPQSEGSTSFTTSNAEDVSFAWCSCPLGEPEAEHLAAAAAGETARVESKAEGLEKKIPDDGQKIQTQEEIAGGCENGGGRGAVPGEGNGSDPGAPASAEESEVGNETKASNGVDSGDGAAQLDEQGEEEDARGKAVYEGWLRSPLGGGKEVYSAGDLDVLALHFAVVKVRCVHLAPDVLCHVPYSILAPSPAHPLFRMLVLRRQYVPRFFFFLQRPWPRFLAHDVTRYPK